MTTTDTMTQTERVLAEMLTENTGRHMCDSGGTPRYDADGRYAGSEHGYGRAYERNAGREFAAEPATTLSFRYSDIEVTHNVYHWLLERVEYCERLDNLFQRYSARQENTYYLEDMEVFPQWLAYRTGATIDGLYGDGAPMTVNTYNGADLLSQVLQYVFFRIDGEAHIVLQIHNGADVRGGYTRPRVFCLSQCCDEADILDNARASIYCKRKQTDAPGQQFVDGCEPDRHPHYWSTDDAYHWYAEGACGLGAGAQLETYERVESDNPDDGDGVLRVDSDGVGYCPICGGRLGAGA